MNCCAKKINFPIEWTVPPLIDSYSHLIFCLYHCWFVLCLVQHACKPTGMLGTREQVIKHEKDEEEPLASAQRKTSVTGHWPSPKKTKFTSPFYRFFRRFLFSSLQLIEIEEAKAYWRLVESRWIGNGKEARTVVIGKRFIHFFSALRFNWNLMSRLLIVVHLIPVMIRFRSVRLMRIFFRCFSASF